MNRVTLVAIVLALLVPIITLAFPSDSFPPADTRIEVTYSFVSKSPPVCYGAYTLALSPGIPGVVWWREAPELVWRLDYLLLTAWGAISIDRICEDEQAGVYWLIGTDLSQANKDSSTVWIRKDLGDGTSGCYNSNTKPFPRGKMPDIARIKSR